MKRESEFATHLPFLCQRWSPAQFPELREEFFAADVASDLRLTPGQVADFLSQPGWAMAYSGHQFGQFVPVLGDGRALLAAEVTHTDGTLIDIHLKGSGRTPFSRGGDGKAPLAPMWREVIYSLALHHLQVPTTRALAVYSTGEKIQRQLPEHGAVLVRTAASHIRVGSFQFAARQGEDNVRTLCDYAIARHYPGLNYQEFFQAVVRAQMRTVAQWMRFGFVHGVMNTDNTTISGETIDFGPCAFTDTYNPQAVFSSIDTQGRYQFGNQPAIVGWNLARLAECLLPLIGTEFAQKEMNNFGANYHDVWMNELAQALGISHADPALAAEVSSDWIAFLHNSQLDITTSMRALSEDKEINAGAFALEFDAWRRRWESLDPNKELMRGINPVYIPRNHMVEHALEQYVRHQDRDLLDQLIEVVRNPYQRNPNWVEFEQPTPEEFGPHRTFCGT
ncbi:MAG: protein adenylyltransferase SelO family protein [Corynebacterium sp.]|uniref:protein adenylyltransferase SelO n=1 Tax=Corynebacterium sp. TaxID=1720 RepID=UPI0026DCA1A6|nr:protein adenylyltransferase SelO family protein [Corynebacterium sp.]MDO4761542.1 protein adenylyltransferase SelO family protein [Corynebacterium sp.]